LIDDVSCIFVHRDETKKIIGMWRFNRTLPGLDNNVINLARNQGCPAWFSEKTSLSLMVFLGDSCRCDLETWQLV